jgi:nucleoside-diphosphate-sugar epimerase
MLEGAGVKTIQRDLLKEPLDGIADDFDVIVNEAVFWNCEKEPEKAFELNCYFVGALYNHFTKAQAFLVASTCSVYRMTAELVEESRLEPGGYYGLTKFAGEIVAGHCSRTRNIPTVILRYVFPFGSDVGNPIDYMAHQIKGVLDGREFPLDKGYQWQQPLFEDDLGRLSIKALDCADVPPEIFIISGTKQYSQKEILNAIGEIFEKQPKMSGSAGPSDKRLVRVDKMKRLLGEPEISFEDALGKIKDKM